MPRHLVPVLRATSLGRAGYPVALAMIMRDGMIGRWARAGTSHGSSARVTLPHPGRCGSATPVIAPGQGGSRSPSGARQLIMTEVQPVVVKEVFAAFPPDAVAGPRQFRGQATMGE